MPIIDERRTLRSNHPRLNQEPTETVISALDFQSQQGLFVYLKREIARSTNSRFLVCKDTPPSWGSAILDNLDEHPDIGRPRLNYNSFTKTIWITLMPTEMHDCHQDWLRLEMFEWIQSGAIGVGEFRGFKYRVGTTKKNFLGDYGNSRKEPDAMIVPDNWMHPSVVIETGWGESLPHLMDDMQLWISGTLTVNVVIILRWSQLSNRTVKGFLKVYTRGPNNSAVEQQTLNIFPETPDQPQAIYISCGQLFGAALPPNSNASTMLPLRLSVLRNQARDAMALMSLNPA